MIHPMQYELEQAYHVYRQTDAAKHRHASTTAEGAPPPAAHKLSGGPPCLVSRAYGRPEGLHATLGRPVRPRAVLWACLLLTIFAVTLRLQFAAEKVTAVGAQCVDMDRAFDPNVLVSMTSEELEYLQGTLCPLTAPASAP